MLKYSIIIPVYNTERYLPECINSVLNQTYSDYELVLVNDGSVDSSGEICDEFAKQYCQKVQVIHTPNQGPAAARNAGVKRASGNVIVFLDSDDCLRDDALAVLTAYFNKFNSDMIFYSASKTPDFQTRSINFSYEDGHQFSSRNKKELYKDLIDGKIPNSLCLKAVKRECYNIGVSVADFAVKHGEDLLTSIQLIENVENIVVCNQQLYYYRQHITGSLTSNYDPMFTLSIKHVHEIIAGRLEKWGIPEYEATHCSRIVRSWVRGVRAVCDKKNMLRAAERKNKLEEYSNDIFFRDAYQRKNNSWLKERDKLMAWCLYEKHYLLLMFLCRAEKVVQQMKRMMKIFSGGVK